MDKWEEAMKAIRARHTALCRMLGKEHDRLYDAPAISTLECDCIQVVMDIYGYRSIDRQNHGIHFGRGFSLDSNRWVEK